MYNENESSSYRERSEQGRKLSYGEAISKLSGSALELVKSEIALMRVEITQASKKLSRDANMAAIFGGLTIASVFPFLAFAVIGLGLLLDGQYWLSSLIVAVICAAIGAIGAYIAIKKFKQDTDLPHSRRALKQDPKSIAAKISEIKKAAKGEFNEQRQDRFH